MLFGKLPGTSIDAYYGKKDFSLLCYGFKAKAAIEKDLTSKSAQSLMKKLTK